MVAAVLDSADSTGLAGAILPGNGLEVGEKEEGRFGELLESRIDFFVSGGLVLFSPVQGKLEKRVFAEV